ncbi:transcriptional regulator [Streptomyces sp. PH10-H1]|uniref:transcriptional regulator n=1 Tax=Streptomyces sp. PH10-H1 TaxID=3046212 RepID=UPI0024B96480|nr:transcriptional regulator [Streptomyces sp. PH10-H1]MDJ0346738.1 transcriptional regulator [Streptomyces sp. PH10-H1]
MEPNTLLDALLDEAGMSHVGLAARVNQHGRACGVALRYDHTAVIRWLKGQRPRGRVPDLLCDIFAGRLQRPITVEDIGMGKPAALQPTAALDGFIARSTALWRGDEQKRRDLFESPTITGLPAVGPVWEWENPPDDNDVSRPGTPRVGLSDVEVLRTARNHYEQMYRKAGGVTTRSRVIGFLTHETAPLLRGSYSDATGRELHRAVGGLVAVAGICSYDSDAQGLAQRYFHQALRLAKASGDRAFGGYVVALLTNQCLYMREYRQAVAFAEAGLRTAGAHISHALATDLYAMQAKAYSRMGDQAGAHRCMLLAESSAGQIRPDEEPAETGYVQPGLVEAQLADALMRLGDLQPAQDYAREAVRVQTHARGRVHRLATLSDIELRSGEADLAASTALEMLTQGQGMESQRLRDRFVSVRKSLAEHSSTATTEAAERIDASLRVPY